jgi:hypothetical protein
MICLNSEYTVAQAVGAGNFETTSADVDSNTCFHTILNIKECDQHMELPNFQNFEKHLPLFCHTGF